MRKLILLATIAALSIAVARGQQSQPLLMQQPTLSTTHIVFAYGSELWSVPRHGGTARPITTGPGQKSNPKFSADGNWIAFTAQYDGNDNVYIMPAGGGQARQLTYDAGPDDVEGWTPDGQAILFQSARDSFSDRYNRLYTISRNGGYAQPLPLPMGYQGSYSPDGSHLAYTPLPREIFFSDGPLLHAFWAHYHGGLAPRIWIASLADSSIVPVPHENASDFSPMWVGNKIYFLSARNEPISLYAYDLKTKKVSAMVDNHGMDLMSASAGPGAIVYEQFGSLHLYNLKTGRERAVPVTIRGNFPQLRPHFEKVADHLLNAAISPTGVRAAFEAHGEILTVAGATDTARHITNSPGVADRSPAWSPNGEWIAYFSDRSGQYALHIRNQTGMGPVRTITLPPAFYFAPVWSPDSRKIAFTDQKLNLWYVDLDHPQPVKVATDTYFTFVGSRGMNPAWSPDSGWIVYTKLLVNRMRAAFVYSLASEESTQITDGMSDAEYAAFDKSGKHIYFTASTNAGPSGYPLDMSSLAHPVTRSVYLVILRKGAPSPLAPITYEEKVTAASKTPAPPAAKNAGAVQIDFEGISQRILALPIPPADYTGLAAGKPGEIFLLESPPTALPFGGGPATLLKFSLASRHTVPLASGIEDFHLSFDGEKFLYRQGKSWGIASTAAPVNPGAGALPMDTMEVWVEPRAEWRQMYREVWRIERQFFYASNFDGLDINAAEQEYAAFLPDIGSRQDLNYLFREMLGKLSTGHTFVAGGDIPQVPATSVGRLGADYIIENGRYRFAKVYSGENWNPGLKAPLTEPGVDVKAGQYLLAVNGRELRATDNIFRFFLNTVGKQAVLTVGPNADGSGSRQVTVMPIPSEVALRGRDWIVHNLRETERLSGGRLAYVYLPNTTVAGFTNFNRYYFAQLGKEGVIVDDRFNSGGQAADYIIEALQRHLWNYWFTPHGAVMREPGETIFGPKAMLINAYAGSGGDLIAWFFHHLDLGPLIGERTWGGEVGITGYPPLIDGGMVTAPSLAFFTTKDHWNIENQGVAPDFEVPMDPHAWRQGRDPQLEKAVEVLLEELRQHPLPEPHVPPFPDYYGRLGRAGF